MADYTDYNDGISGKGVIAALLIIGAIIFAVAFFAPASSISPDGAVSSDPASATQSAPAADPTAAPALD